jgi:hypothetical protein
MVAADSSRRFPTFLADFDALPGCFPPPLVRQQKFDDVVRMHSAHRAGFPPSTAFQAWWIENRSSMTARQEIDG